MSMSEPLLREVNVRIYERAREWDEPSEYVCECGLPACEKPTLRLEPHEVADLLAMSGCILVAPGHDAPGAKIVRQGRDYLFVRVED